jgi:excisionase family DNA binding protein
MADSIVGDDGMMPPGSVIVVNPALWASRPQALAPLLAAAGGRPEGTRTVPDASGALPTSTVPVADPAYWSTSPAELADALRVATSEEATSSGRSPVGSGVGAAPTSQERLTLTVEEAAALLGISRAFAYDAVRRGEIPAIKIGRRILVPILALNRLLEMTGEGLSEEASET